RPGGQVPRAVDRVRLRHRARARDRGPERHGQGLSAGNRPREYGAAQDLRRRQRGGDAGRAQCGDRAPQAGARMSERIAFLTGHLAQPRLEKVLAGMGETEFGWSVVNVGVKVAALMTEAIIARRLSRPVEATRVVVPGRCRADLARLSVEFGVPFERGPEELHDLPAYFGKGGRGLDLSRSDIRIFAEIVEAPMLGVDDILARARTMRTSGADVIDLGGLPDTPFPHLADAVGAL